MRNTRSLTSAESQKYMTDNNIYFFFLLFFAVAPSIFLVVLLLNMFPATGRLHSAISHPQFESPALKWTRGRYLAPWCRPGTRVRLLHLVWGRVSAERLMRYYCARWMQGVPRTYKEQEIFHML